MLKLLQQLLKIVHTTAFASIVIAFVVFACSCIASPAQEELKKYSQSTSAIAATLSIAATLMNAIKEDLKS